MSSLYRSLVMACYVNKFLFCAQVLLLTHRSIQVEAVNYTSSADEALLPSSWDFTQVSSDRRSGPWSEILEDYWTNPSLKSSRTSRVMKFGDAMLTIVPKPTSSNKREVSETDLYLLGAIEKLVYRVDYLENRLQRAEELLYHILSGNVNKKEQCPENSTRIRQNCYHFSNREFDWKSSASLCRGMGGDLVEFESVEEKQKVAKVIQLADNNKLKAKQHFWTGGLNPGLLWIWASTAKPVYHDAKETVPGDGRCLLLAYNTTSKAYAYRSDDCGVRHKYICKLAINDEFTIKVNKHRLPLSARDNRATTDP